MSQGGEDGLLEHGRGESDIPMAPRIEGDGPSLELAGDDPQDSTPATKSTARLRLTPVPPRGRALRCASESDRRRRRE